MGTSPLFNPHRRVRCPKCGSEKLQLRNEPDRIDRVVQTPSDRVKRLFIADMQLYHCRVCRVQFYDASPTAEAPIRATGPAVRDAPAVRGAPAPAVPAESGSTVIGETVRIKGRLSSAENIILNGEIDGDLDIPAHRLTIGIAGRMRGDVQAAEAVALGTVEGTVDARRRFAIRASARITGTIRTPSLNIEEGAFVEGSVETA